MNFIKQIFQNISNQSLIFESNGNTITSYESNEIVLASGDKNIMNLLKEMIDCPEIVTINVSHGGEAIIGDVETSTIDLTDMIGASTYGISVEQSLLHETLEQYYVQVKGRSFRNAHNFAAQQEVNYANPGHRLDEQSIDIDRGEIIRTTVDPLGNKYTNILYFNPTTMNILLNMK